MAGLVDSVKASGDEKSMSDVLWLGLTQDGLDQQLNLRARWPSHQAVLDRWAKESARTRDALADQVILHYGAHELQSLDLFRPTDAPGPHPILVFVHGGYWQSLDKGDFSYLAPTFLAQGIAFASINYRLAPKASLSEICTDVTAALDHLQSRAADLGCCDSNFVMAGHSAGGHLVMQELIRERRTLAEGIIDRPRTAALAAISGVYDLEPLRRSYQQMILSIDAREVAELSPLRNAPASAPPVLVAVGDQETPEFVRQQNALVALWQALGLPIQGLQASGEDHFRVVDLLAKKDHVVTRWLIKACLANSRRKV